MQKDIFLQAKRLTWRSSLASGDFSFVNSHSGSLRFTFAARGVEVRLAGVLLLDLTRFTGLSLSNPVGALRFLGGILANQ